MTKDELAALVVDYAHRPDLLERTQDTFIGFAQVRIGRALKSKENEAALALNIASNPETLPDDYGDIRAFQYEQDRGPVTLTSLDLHSINQWAKTGGTPARYTIAAGAIEIRPFIAGDYTLFYYLKPALADGASTNAVLETWPMVYLYGALIELNVWAQDAEQRDIALAAFAAEVKDINLNAARGLGEKPAMRRA